MRLMPKTPHKANLKRNIYNIKSIYLYIYIHYELLNKELLFRQYTQIRRTNVLFLWRFDEKLNKLVI